MISLANVLDKKYREKLLLVSVVIQPGLHRFLFFFIAAEIVSIEDFSFFASSYSLGQFVSFFISIGFCTMLFVKIPRLNSFSSEKLFVKYLLWILSMGFLLIIPLSFLGKFEESVLILFWSVYQLMRAFLISKRNYITLIRYDILIIIISIPILYFIRSGIIALAISYFITTCIFICFIKINKSNLTYSIPKKDLFNIGLNSTSNGISTGLLQLIPFMVSILFSIKVTAAIGLMMTFGIILYLATRALSFKYYPILTKGVDDFIKLKEQFQSYRNVNFFVILVSNAFIISFYMIINFFFQLEILALDNSILIMMSLLLFLSIMQICAPWFVMLNVLEDQVIQLKVNGLTFIIAIAFIAVYYFYKFEMTAVNFFLCFSALYLARLLFIAAYLEVRYFKREHD